jgi:hypothetical protein
MSKISCFTSKAVSLAKNAVGGGCFADYTTVSHHCLQICIEKPYREAFDSLSEIPHILADIGLEEGDLPHYST